MVDEKDIPVLDVDYHLREYDEQDVLEYLEQCYSFNRDPAFEKAINEIKLLREKNMDLETKLLHTESYLSLERSDNQRLREKCDKQAMFFRQYFVEKYPDTPFISAVIGERDQNGMPKYIWVVPSYGVDFSYVYEYTGKTVGGMGS
jgi:hypothetical protein